MIKGVNVKEEKRRKAVKGIFRNIGVKAEIEEVRSLKEDGEWR